MATSNINTIKTTDVFANLSTLTWTTSGGGKHYATIGTYTNSEILSVAIKDWSYLRDTDIIQPAIKNNGYEVELISNVKTFANANSYVKVKVVYR